MLDRAHAAIAPGVTTDYIDKVVHDACIEYGAYPSPYNYYNFPKSVCTSVNEVICHGIPDRRKLEDGDIVNVDVSVYYKGWHGDLNETFVVGNASQAAKDLVKTTYEVWMDVCCRYFVHTWQYDNMCMPPYQSVSRMYAVPSPGHPSMPTWCEI